jgi:hypothetical protein
VSRRVRDRNALCIHQNAENISPGEDLTRAEISVVRDGHVSASRRKVDLTVCIPSVVTNGPEAPAARLCTSAYKSQIDTDRPERAPASRQRGATRHGQPAAEPPVTAPSSPAPHRTATAPHASPASRLPPLRSGRRVQRGTVGPSGSRRVAPATSRVLLGRKAASQARATASASGAGRLFINGVGS